MSLKFERPFATVTAVSTANVEGTSPLSARADHVHAHEATHVLHDTAWAAKGDILGGSANDTALVLTVGADDTILMADAAAATGLKWVASASPSAVGTAAATGTADTFTRGDHVHAHEAGHVAHDTLWDAKGDVVTGSGADTAVRTAVGTDGTFLKADSAGGGGVSWVDHTGAADPHTGYLLESLFDAKGDLITASADNTPAKLTVGANDTILMADSAAAGGLKWVADAAPVAVGTANAAGTSDDFSRASHVHAHETGHVVHDTIWDAKGDLAAGTGADTASALTVGANDTILMADSAAGTGLKWVASATPGNSAVGDVAAVGTADTFTRGDHVHGREAFAAPTTISTANASGAATTINRSDHVHAHGSIAGTTAVHPDLATLSGFVAGAKWYTD